MSFLCDIPFVGPHPQMSINYSPEIDRMSRLRDLVKSIDLLLAFK